MVYLERSGAVVCILAVLLSAGPADAAEFPSTLPAAQQPRYSGVRAFYLDERGGGLNLSAGQLRLEGFYRAGQTGLAADVHWQYLFGYTPAIVDGRVPWLPGQATQDVSLGVGWRFGDHSWAITPELQLRNLSTGGINTDSMWALGPAAYLEYSIFPEATTLSLRVAETFGFSHSGSSGGPDLVSAGIPLASLDLRISYRVIRPLEMSVGFQVWQVPSDFGRGRLLTSDTAWLRGFYLGAGVLF